MRTVLHLVRAGSADPPGAVAERDWVVYLQPMQLAQAGAPDKAPDAAPIPPGPIDHDQLVALIFAADLVVTW